jgi:hypothetical protein
MLRRRPPAAKVDVLVETERLDPVLAGKVCGHQLLAVLARWRKPIDPFRLFLEPGVSSRQLRLNPPLRLLIHQKPV